MESTFFQFGIKTNFLKLIQNKIDMELMVYHILGENENFIFVIDQKIIQILTKNIIHLMLKDNRCIGKAKGHHNTFKMAITNFECRLPFMPSRMHTKLYVPHKSILVYTLA